MRSRCVEMEEIMSPPTFFFVYPASHVTVMTKESPDRPDVILPREPRTVVAAAPLVFLGNLTVRHDAPYRLKSVAFFLFEKKKKKSVYRRRCTRAPRCR